MVSLGHLGDTIHTFYFQKVYFLQIKIAHREIVDTIPRTGMSGVRLSLKTRSFFPLGGENYPQ